NEYYLSFAFIKGVRQMENIQLTNVEGLANLQEGEKLVALKKDAISRVQLAQYTGASGVLKTLHLDDDLAKQVRLDGAMTHGQLIMGFLGKYVMKIANKQVKVVNLKMRFGRMTFPGDAIECSGLVKEIFELNGKRHIELELYATKDSGDVVGTGSATLQLAK